MRQQSSRWWFAGVMFGTVALLAVVGCGSDGVVGGNVENEAPELGIDLSDPYGGIGSGTEAPGFADDGILGTLVEDDPVTVTEDGVPPESDVPVVLYLRAVWGRVAEAPEIGEDEAPDCGLLSWDGGLSVTDGVIRPVSTIRFERRGDYADSLVFPREDKSVLEWGSTTGCGQDGVVIAVLLPRASDAAGSADGLTPDDEILFATGPLTASFRLVDLARLDTTIMVDDVNGVSFTGFERGDMDDVCRRGRIVGVWAEAETDTEEGRGGYFRGAWLNPVGQLVGHMRGRWGTTDDRGNLFIGKVISVGGEYQGHVRGMWDARGQGDHGGFRGRWIVVADGAEESHRGGISGHWGIGHGRRPDENGERRGSMRGLWAAKCNRNVDDDFGNDGDPGDGDGHRGGDNDGGDDENGNGGGNDDDQGGGNGDDDGNGGGDDNGGGGNGGGNGNG